MVLRPHWPIIRLRMTVSRVAASFAPSPLTINAE